MFSRSLKFIYAAGSCYFVKTFVCSDYPFQAYSKNFALADAELPQKSDFPSSIPVLDCPIKLTDVVDMDIKTDGSIWEKGWDKRERLQQAQRKVNRRILLINSGDYIHTNCQEYGCLSDKGKKDASFTGNRLKHLYQSGTTNHISMIVNSKLTRAQQTASIIKSKLPLPGFEENSTDLLKEGYPCKAVPNLLSENLVKEYKYFQQGAQIEAGFRDIFYRPLQNHNALQVEVYVCHSHVIQYFVMRALQFPKEMWSRLNIRSGSITEIAIKPNGVVEVSAIGEYTHMRCAKYGKD